MGKEETQGLWVCLSLLVVLSAVLTWGGQALSQKIASPKGVSKTPSRERNGSLIMKAPFRSTRADSKVISY